MNRTRIVSFFKDHKRVILASVIIVAVLTAAFFYPDFATPPQTTDTPAVYVPTATLSSTAATTTTASLEQATVPTAPTETAADSTDPTTAKTTAAPTAPLPTDPPTTTTDLYHTAPVPEDKPQPSEPQEITTGTAKHTCTISISCATILQNMEFCDPDKRELVPADGWILPPTTVTFQEGENVFVILQRVCRERKIHMEFKWTPLYNSAYIQGIGNLYEFDVGPLSGWMYAVNDWFPNYGCSRYALSDGDNIRLVFTCNLGNDVGGSGAIGG